jgi:flagellar motor component MotA
MAKDLLLTLENDLKIVNGDFVFGESELQEVGIILQMNQGELKSDPFIGANLNTMIRGVRNNDKIRRHIETQMELDDKDYDTIKDYLTIKKH